MNIYFHTNLDEPKLPYDLAESFKEYIGETNQTINRIPAIGSYIAIPYYGYELELQVVGHYYTLPDKQNKERKASLRIELHIPRVPAMSVAEWEKRLRGLRDNPRY